MIRQPWTDAEVSYLVAHYSTDQLHAIAAHLGRSFEKVQDKSYALIKAGALKMSDRFWRRPWTEAEDDYLNDQWGVLPSESVAKSLNRTVEACSLRAERHGGFCRRSNVWSARNVADLFGVDSKTVKRWIDRGWITAKRAGFGAGQARSWNVDDGSLETFVRTMGWAYDWHRMIEGERLTRVAREFDKRDPWLTIDECAASIRYNRGTVHRWTREGLACQYRPKQSQRGPHEGRVVIQKSVFVAYVAAKRAAEHENRSKAAKARARRQGWRVLEAA